MYDSRNNEVSEKIIRLLDDILVAAFKKDASEIYISKSSGTSFQIDGRSQQYLNGLPESIMEEMLTWIKTMGGLCIAERTLPQIGKIRSNSKGMQTLELRVTIFYSSGDFDVALKPLSDCKIVHSDHNAGSC